MRILALSTVFAALATSGCGTTTGTLCGTTGGGASLTANVWQSDANPVVKTILTPATIVGGTAGGLGMGLFWGMAYDVTYFKHNIPLKDLARELSDPFKAGFFDPAPPEQYFVMLDEKILGTVKPERRGDTTEASSLALALEPVKTAGAVSINHQGGTIVIISEKGAKEARAKAVRAQEAEKLEEARELEALNATTVLFTVVAEENSYSALTKKTLRIPLNLMAPEASEAFDLFMHNEFRPHQGVFIRTDKTNKVITLSRKPASKNEKPGIDAEPAP